MNCDQPLRVVNNVLQIRDKQEVDNKSYTHTQQQDITVYYISRSFQKFLLVLYKISKEKKYRRYNY